MIVQLHGLDMLKRRLLKLLLNHPMDVEMGVLRHARYVNVITASVYASGYASGNASGANRVHIGVHIK